MSEYATNGAMLACTCGTTPTPLQVTSNTLSSSQGQSIATISDKVPMANIKPFGPCKMKPTISGFLPCIPAPTAWTGFVASVQMPGGNPLLKTSTIMCSCGGMIQFQDSGQKKPAKVVINPSSPQIDALKQAAINGTPFCEECEKSEEYEKSEEQLKPNDIYGMDEDQVPHQASELLPSQINIEIINIEIGDFIPLGIPNKQKKEVISDKIKIKFKIEHSDAKSYVVKIKDSDDIAIFEAHVMQPIIVRPDDANSTKDESLGYAPGEYIYEWDGFDRDGVYDTTKMKGKFFVEISVKGSQGQEASDKKDFSCKRTEAEWMDVTIDKNKKEINVTLRLDIRDKGDTGLNKGRKVPAEVVKEVGQPVITERKRSFDDLKKLLTDGITKHWSRVLYKRVNGTIVDRRLNIGGDIYSIVTTAEHDPENSMDDIGLRYVTNESLGRSSNPGSTTWNPYTWVANLAYQRVYYNVGYVKDKNGWRYITDSKADNNFMSTADNNFMSIGAHEVGHEILKCFGGAVYSYNHKGTSTTLQKSKDNTPYPKTGNIDLMKYSSENQPYDYNDRAVASDEDVFGMLWLTKIEIK